MTDQEIEKLARKYIDVGMGNGDIPKFDHVGFARALLSRAIPEGHVVVPKKPTQEMLDAGSYGHTSGGVYEKMLTAAPANKEGE